MFTKNYHKAYGAVLTRSNISVSNVAGASQTLTHSDAASILRYMNDNTQNYTYPSLHRMATSLGKYGGAIIGTGRAAPTADDIALSGTMITTFSASATVTSTIDESGVELSAAYLITNTGDTDFTIGEIGLISASTNSANQTYKILWERSTLDAPVTIPAGGIGQVTYTIRMNYPTA